MDSISVTSSVKRAARGDALRAGCRTLPRQRSVSPDITLSEADGVRYLHFGSIWVQGAMRISRPFSLEVEYQQQMMAPALLHPRPAHIVQLGLGAAALTKFCWRELPGARITVVEISADVVAAARRWFKLPASDDRLGIVVADAAAAVLDHSRAAFDGQSADWLQVDLYDAEAAGPVHDSPEFYAGCRRMLSPRGIAVINLFGRSFEQSLRAIESAFGNHWVALPEADAGNRVVLAFARPTPVAPSTLYARAVAMQTQWRIPARRWVGALRSAGLIRKVSAST